MARPLEFAWYAAAVNALSWKKRQLSMNDDAMNIEPRRVSLMPVLVGCGLNLFVFGLVLGTGGALLNAVATTIRVLGNTNVATTNTGRRASALAIVTLAAVFGALRLAFDVHTAQRVWKSDTYSYTNVIDGTDSVEDPIGIRTLCALTACMALPQFTRQIKRMVRRAVVPAIVTLFVTMTVLVAIGTGIVASVLRAGSSDPGWAADNDHSVRQTMQLTMYAGLTLSCILVGLETCKASRQHQAKNNTLAFDDECDFPCAGAAAIAIPGLVSLIVLLTSLLCIDHSTPLIALMPLGNIFTLVYLVDKYLATAHRQARMATAMAQPQAQVNPSSLPPQKEAGRWKDGSTGHESSSSSVVDFELNLPSLSSHSCVNMPVHHDKLAATMTAPSVRKMNVDFGTPTFLRSDPYAAASMSPSSSNTSTSPASSRKTSPASSLRRPARVRSKRAHLATTERCPPLVSSPLSRSVSTLLIEEDVDSTDNDKAVKKEKFRQSQQALVLMQRALIGQEQSDLRIATASDVLGEIDGEKECILFETPKHKKSMSFKSF